MAFEHDPHLVEVDAQDLAKRLGVQPLAEVRGALQIGEDDRDGPPNLLCHRLGHQARAAHPAHSEPIRVLLPAARTDLHVRSLGGGLSGPMATFLEPHGQG